MLAYLLVRAVLFLKPSAAGKLLDLLVPRYRRIARENLIKAGYSNPEPIIDGVFRSIGRIFTTFEQFPKINRQNVHEWIHYDGLENFTGPMARGRCAGRDGAPGELGAKRIHTRLHDGADEYCGAAFGECSD